MSDEKRTWYQRTHQFTPYTKADGTAVSDEFDAIQASFERIPAMRDDGKGFATSPLIPEPSDPNHPVPFKMLTETEASVNNARDDVIKKAQQVASAAQEVAKNTQITATNTQTAQKAATSALSSSQSADESENMARKWASNPENEVVLDEKYSAYHYAQKAAQLAVNLASAESSATQSATIATQKAEEATQAAKKAESLAVGEVDYAKVLNVPRSNINTEGVVRLTNDTGLESESLALTAKAGKKLAQQTAQLQLNVSQNYIPNSKKSSAVNSESEDDVATSKAAKTAYDKGVEAKTAADNANQNAEGRVSKSGDTMTGQLNANSGVYTLARGADGFDRQWQNPVAPYLVDNGNANGNNAYYPFIKGINRNGYEWGTAFSFGYETPDGINKFGKGCIHLIEDNGTQKLWRFEHNGDFNSAGDVCSSNGKSINNSVQISELVGEVAFFARITPPSGWLKANGAAVSRTTYAALFAAIGTTFGAGDGSSTFNLPDLRGEFVRGLDDGRNVDAGRRLGTTQGDAIRNITGAFDTSKGSWVQQFVDFAETSGAFDLIKGNKQWTGDPNNGGNNLPTGFKFDASRVVPTANENRPRNVALLACIKY